MLAEGERRLQVREPLVGRHDVATLGRVARCDNALGQLRERRRARLLVGPRVDHDARALHVDHRRVTLARRRPAHDVRALGELRERVGAQADRGDEER
ncbi:hypothetical protein T492DRAFT_503359 [Pavlovales sp. CCMP2436]|nr:hypothetical protein T492DRAFT_503359 [Pavlovales sp. CCMP2436]